jgi:enterobacterial common antigen flippase
MSSSYRNILKTTSLIGGASLASIIIGMIRIKFAAVLIGPDGVGLIGIYSTIIGMVSSIAGMGLGNSGVRQIAAAHGATNVDCVARTVKTLRRTVWLTGTLGMLGMVFGCTIFSRISFGSTDYALSIALLGIVIFLANITTGQSCVLQGTRRIADLAKVSVLGAVIGTTTSILCLYFMGSTGIVPSLILNAVSGLATSWWYTSRLAISTPSMPWRESKNEAVNLLKFGIPLMFTGLMGTLTAYIISSILARHFGLKGVGIWQAALNLSGVIASFVLNAMGQDYFPRLAAVADNNLRVGEEVNKQTEISLLLATPCLAATIIFAPLVITLFYSSQFSGAVDILRWAIYGVFGRIISYPLGYVLLAKGRGKTFLCTETFNNAFYILAIFGCTNFFGITGTGIAFLLLYVVVTLVNYSVANAISHTKWTQSNTYHSLAFGGLLVFVGITSTSIANFWVRHAIDIIVLSALSAYCLNRLAHKSGVTLQTLWSKVRPASGQGHIVP